MLELFVTPRLRESSFWKTKYPFDMSAEEDCRFKVLASPALESALIRCSKNELLRVSSELPLNPSLLSRNPNAEFEFCLESEFWRMIFGLLVRDNFRWMAIQRESSAVAFRFFSSFLRF